MTRLRTWMSKIKEVLHLKFNSHLSNRRVTACLNVGCTTISNIVTSFKTSPLPEDIAEKQLEALLYNGRSSYAGKQLPDFPLRHLPPSGAEA